MIVIVTVFEAAGLAVSESKSETMMLRTPDQTSLAPPRVIEAADQRYTQETQLLYLGGIIIASAELLLEIERRIRLMWACLRQFDRELYDVTTAQLSLQPRMRKVELIETLLYWCMTWTLRAKHLSMFRLARDQVPLRVVTLSRYISYKWISINISYICHV